jgi:hypothetical protein
MKLLMRYQDLKFWLWSNMWMAVFGQYNLLLVQSGTTKVNVYICGRVGDWLACRKARGSSMVVLNSWRISKREYMRLKNA